MSIDESQFMSRLMAAANSQDAARAANLYTEDATYHADAETILNGKEEIQGYYEMFFTALPDFHVEATSVVSTGNTLAFEGTVRGTHKGPMPGPDGDIPATGNSVELHFASFLDVNDSGLVQEDRTYFDTAALMSQLGAD